MTEEEIKYGLENRKVKLNNLEKISHYGIVALCFIIPLTFTTFHLLNYFSKTSQPLKTGNIWFLIIPSLIGVLFFLQKNTLKFKEINTNLNNSELNEIIKKVTKELKWSFDTLSSKVIIAKTNPGFLSGSWGERITILFEKNKVLVNSICDPNKKSSVVSMGRNKQNENKLIESIKKAYRKQ